MNMRTLLIVLMSEYGDTFLLSFYVELKSMSHQISLQQEIFKKPLQCWEEQKIIVRDVQLSKLPARIPLV